MFGELPEDVYPRPEDRNPWRPPRQAPGADIVRVSQQANFSPIPFIATIQSKQLLAANRDRVYLLVQNKGVASIYINFDGQASSASLEIKAGVTYEPIIAPTNSVSVLASAGSISGIIIQGTKRID